jgi:chemotaxis protein methyltransferase CheR
MHGYSPPTTSMTDEEFGLLADYVHEKFGLFFEPDKRQMLEFKLRPRLKLGGFSSFKQYYHHLMFHPSKAGEETRLIAALTNHESYFFREINQLTVFTEEVLPELIRERGSAFSGRLRILSAGCSTGEEPYTIATMIHESGLADRYRFEITGIDLDPVAVDFARAANYTRNSMRATPEDKLRLYFTKNDELFQLNDKIRNMVDFQQANIVAETFMAGKPKFDFIFCRNVLIYFSRDSIRRATDNYSRLLTKDGLLFLGHSESLLSVTPLYAPVRRPKAIYYRKV